MTAPALPRKNVPAFIASLLLINGATAFAGDYQPELFQKTKPVYADSFDGSLRDDVWEVRQATTWTVEHGILTGKPASPEYQQKKKATGDAAHAGLRPVIWLKQIPQNFACSFRVRFDGKDYQKGFPLIDIGHHVHTLCFSGSGTTLRIKKEGTPQPLKGIHFSLNEWHSVALELKKGVLLVSVDGAKQIIRDESIDMTGQSQIDFKGLDGGSCQIDDLHLLEGLD